MSDSREWSGGRAIGIPRIIAAGTVPAMASTEHDVAGQA